MHHRKFILSILVQLVVSYGILIFPWPGWNDLYSQGFRAVGNAIFGSSDGNRVLYFEVHRQTQGLASLDSRIVLANRALADNNGNAPGRYLGIDPRSIGWKFTALTITLIAATPHSMAPTNGGTLLGLILIPLFIVFSVWVYIWNESTEVSLVTLSPFWKEMLTRSNTLL